MYINGNINLNISNYHKLLAEGIMKGLIFLILTSHYEPLNWTRLSIMFPLPKPEHKYKNLNDSKQCL